MAVYEGWFPIPGSTVASGLFEVWMEGYDMKNTYHGGIGTLPGSVASSVRNVTENQTNGRTSGYNPDLLGPFGLKVTGIPTPTPSDKLLESEVVKTNNKPFIKRMRAGEMVVSDYKRFQALLRFKNGGDKVSSGVWTISHKTRSLGSVGWEKVNFPFGNFNNAYRPSSTSRSIDGSFRVDYQSVVSDDTLTAYDVGFKDAWVLELFNQLRVPDDIKTQTVMSVLSEANAASVDILTAMAEMPETVRSALAGCKQVLNMVRDAKRREFSILERGKRARVDYEQHLAESRRLFAERRFLAAHNKRALARLAIEEERKSKQLKNDLKKTLKAIADAVSSVWLNFRYNIMPNVYLIEGVVKALDEIDVLYKRFSDSSELNIDVTQRSGWNITLEIPVTFRCFIKRMYEKLNGYSRLLKEFSANIARTLWELVPLSFVVDWFINVGNLMSTLLGGTQHSGFQEAATISLKVNSTVNFTHIVSGASVAAEIKGYERRVINPSSYCGLFWSPDLNPDREKDAAALSWQIFIRNFTFLRKI